MANNPYKVLGVSDHASDEQIRLAYRELVKKYHPDRYSDNPLKDLADEKLREINSAYEQIQSQRKTGAGFRTSESPREGEGPKYDYQRDVYGRGYDETACDLCKICQCLICADCLCNCCSG